MKSQLALNGNAAISRMEPQPVIPTLKSVSWNLRERSRLVLCDFISFENLFHCLSKLAAIPRSSLSSLCPLASTLLYLAFNPSTWLAMFSTSDCSKCLCFSISAVTWYGVVCVCAHARVCASVYACVVCECGYEVLKHFVWE